MDDSESIMINRTESSLVLLSFTIFPVIESLQKKKKKNIKLLTYFRNLFFAYWKDFDMLDKLPFGGEMATL